MALPCVVSIEWSLICTPTVQVGISHHSPGDQMYYLMNIVNWLHLFGGQSPGEKRPLAR